MKLALCQMENAGTPKANLDKSIRAIEEAAERCADLILFPEVQLTEFFPQYPGLDAGRYALSLDSDTVKVFQESCRRYKVMAVPNIYLSENGKKYDASILIDSDGSIIGVQKMVHVAQAAQFYEQDYYTPSDDGFKVFDTHFGRIGIVVCFDRHYPESIRTQALRGAQLILIPTVNTKAEPLEMFEWEVRVQAFQNSVAIAMCNRVGREDSMEFAGESLVIDADGGIVRKGDDREQIIYAAVDPERSTDIRNSRPYTSLRRPKLYEA